MKHAIFAVVGGALGYPISFFFQNEMIQHKVGGFGGYIQHIGDILGSGGAEIGARSTALSTMAICAVIGLVISIVTANK